MLSEGMSEVAIADANPSPDVIAEVTTVVRRVVAGRVSNRDAVDEIVQETLARVLATRGRLDDRSLFPFAIVTARNLVASQWRSIDTGKRNEHRLLDRDEGSQPEDGVVEEEEAQAVRAALDRLMPVEREVLVAHEVAGQDTRSIADEHGMTPGAVSSQLHRARARLRVEYLLEMDGRPPPSSQCHSVLLALSAGDQRRQAEVDAGHHLLECDFCAELSEPLFDRRAKSDADPTRIAIRMDADIVTARQRGRDVAMLTGFSATEATMIATAISEIARNIVRFARRGEIAITQVTEDGVSGVTIVARDAGPGIADLDQAMVVGYTTYGGHGLGLPGSRRLMDEFEITSEPGRGTTVAMTKWHRR